MALPAVNGTLDQDLGIVLPNNTGTWANLTTWANWTSWTLIPANPLIWLADLIDLGEVTDFCLIINTVANGTVEYDIYVSDTGAFAGEESVTSVYQGDQAVTGFTGRFVRVAVKVTRTSGINTLSSVECRASNSTVQVRVNDLDTSTLSGTSAARTLTLPRTVSKIINLQITPKSVNSYIPDLYVSNTATSTQVIPKWLSKDLDSAGGPPTIALVGIDNQPRDAVVDIIATALPEQYMLGNDLKTR